MQIDVNDILNAKDQQLGVLSKLHSETFAMLQAANRRIVELEKEKAALLTEPKKK